MGERNRRDTPPLRAASVSDRNNLAEDEPELCPQRTMDMKPDDCCSRLAGSGSHMLLRDEYLMARDFIISYAETHPKAGLLVSGQSGIGSFN